MADIPAPGDRRGLLKDALRALEEMQGKLHAAEEGLRWRTEPIAIVGMGCRFPGGAVDPDQFWEVLRDGRDAVTAVPPERWSAARYQELDPALAAARPHLYGAFLADVDHFDANFFGIAPREALSMDPQHRLVLEVCWEALEHAGIAPRSLAGSATGVFVGVTASDYWQHLRTADPQRLDVYIATGNSHNAAAGRVAFALGLQGPAMAVDTACSSSLTAVHLACQSLRLGESHLALAGGVNTMHNPDSFFAFHKWGMMAGDGRCKTFDAAADGFVRGEGCGFVVLKRLSDAVTDGDQVLATIRGSAVNQDGATSGFTVPNGRAQEAVIRQALAQGSVAPAAVGYVEAHGTGTALGDPIELEALDAVLSEARPANRPLVVGSVKTNFGHLESAAGIAGLIKVVLALQHDEIPAHLHFKSFNPKASFGGAPFVVPTSARPWPARAGEPRIAGVSSFGISGTNAHVVVAEAAPRQRRTVPRDRPLHLITLSAATEPALAALAKKWEGHLERGHGHDLGDLAAAANTGRTHLSHRAAIVAASIAEAKAGLTALVKGEPSSRLARGTAAAGPPKIAFLFTGQGSQYVGMGRELYEQEPVFRAALERCAAGLAGELPQPLLSVLYPEPGERSPIDETQYTQPALFAVEYALAALWASWGVVPALVLGHSVGEYVAACVAGVLELADALRLVAARGRLMGGLPAGGAMAAVAASESVVRARLVGDADGVAIAAVNGPASVVVSGPEAAVGALCAEWTGAGIRTQRLSVSHAFHSALMEPMLDAFEAVAAAVPYGRPRLGLIANVTGRRATAGEVGQAGYWRAQVRQPVQFAAGLAALAAEGATVFVEVGPTATLLGLGQGCVAGAETAAWLPSLRKDTSAWPTLLGTLGALYVRGVEVQWRAVDAAYPRCKVTLPTYPFQRERYWIEARPRPEVQPAADWFYQLQWRQQPLGSEPVASRAVAGACLVMSDRGGVGTALAAALERRGVRCITVTSAGSAESLHETVMAASPLAHVVHLWNLDAPHASATTDETLAAAQVAGVQSLLLLVQALKAAPAAAGTPPPRIFTVTALGAPGFPAAEVTPAQAPVWGAGRVIALEHPEYWGALIDVGASSPADAAAHVLTELEHHGREDQVAYRDGARHVARLVRVPTSPHSSPALRRDATYLITGGTGGIGLVLAGWMADRGAKHLVLVSRGGMSSEPALVQVIETLQLRGVAVRLVAADVGNRAQMAALVDELTSGAAPLRGVVHAAGILRNDDVAEMTVAAAREVFRPKMAGAWILHELTRATELDFFVLFSSAAAVWGSRGLAHYAAANAFLDALSQHRRAQGLAAVSINWGPWRVGMASADDQRLMAAIGVAPFSTAEGLRALEHVIGTGQVQLTAAKVDWRMFAPIYAARAERRLLQELVGGQLDPAGAPSDRGELARRIAAALPADRRELLVAALQVHVAAVLGLEGTLPNPRQGLTDLGMDSLMAVEIRQQVQHALGQILPPTLAFDAPTIDDMATFLLTTLGSPEAETRPRAEDIESVDPLSDEEVRALLVGELAELSLHGLAGEDS